MAVIQESKLTLNSRTPNIQNFTTVRKDCNQGQGGGLLTLIHKSINLSRRPDTGKHRLDHYQHIHTPSKLLHSGSSDDDDGHSSKRHSLQAVELSQRTQAAVQIVSNLPGPSNGGPIYRFWGHAGHADPLDGWR